MTDIHESLKPLAVSIESLTPDPSNARKHDKRNIEAIKASLARFGQTKPIVLHTNGTTIIAGNGTWYAAKELGWTHIAAAKTNLDTAEAVAYGIADNKTAELAEWEDDTLRDLMDALPDDLKLATGFEGDEIAEMLRLPSDEVHEDEVPPTPKEPTTQAGDLWLLGDHRLMCASCLEVENRTCLYGSTLIDAVVTDPPYGTGIKADKGLGNSNVPMNLIGDEDTSLAEAAVEIFVPEAPKQVWFGANYYSHALRGSKQWLVWDKDHHGMTFADAELAWTNSDKPVRVFRHAWSGNHRASEKSETKGHPTQKPVALFDWIYDIFKVEMTVLDPFAGSGSSLLAAHKADITWYGFELEPKYCDVIVQRWENLTGKKAERVPAEVGDASTVGS